MPDVANFKEYSELKGLLDSSPDAPPERIATAQAALKRYEDQYLGGNNVAVDQSLLAPGTTGAAAIREAGDPVSQETTDRYRYTANEKSGLRALGGSLGGEGDLSSLIDTRRAPGATAIAAPPTRISRPAIAGLGVYSPGDSPVVATTGQALALGGHGRAASDTAHDMPTHVGGGTIQVIDPPVGRFVRDVAPELQKTMNPLDFAAMMEDPGQSQQYQQWSDQEWNRQSAEAAAKGLSAKRLKASILDTYEPDQSLGDAIGEKANQAFDMLSGGSAAAGRTLTLGGTTKLAQAVGGQEAARALKDSEERHPIAGTAATVVAGANPLNPGNLAARGINSALLAGGAKIAPSLTGFMPFIGRTAAAGVAGGLSATGESVARTAIEDSATGKPFEIDWGNAGKQGLLGTALGSAFHIAGEGFGALNKSTEKTYETELRDARRVGAEPGLGGVKLAPGSPVQALEDARVAQELPSGADVAAGRVAPRIADEGAAIKTREIAQAKADTGQAYARLARGKPLSDPELETPLPQYSLDDAPLPQYPSSDVLDDIGLDGAKATAELNPDKLASVRSVRQSGGATKPVEVAIYPDEGNGPVVHLADGRHRLAVAREAGETELDAVIRHYDSDGNVVSTEQRPVPIRGRGVPAKTRGGAGPTLPPGPADTEADAFGRIAQEQGENQASLLGVQQAAQRGGHVTPDPVTVSTAPVVEKVLDIVRRHNPAGGEIPFLPSDNILREHLPKMAKMQYVPLAEAKAQLARSGKGWIQPAEDGSKLGLGGAPDGTVLLVIPRKMDAPSFDAMVQALDDKASFTGELKKGDPRFQELAAVAHDTRKGFPGLNALKQKQTEGFTATDTMLGHAGVRVGKGGKAKNWTAGGADQQKSVENAVKQFKQQGNRLTDDALRTVAKLGGFEAELNQIPGQVAVEKLEKTMRTGENLPASDAGLVRRGYQVGRLHLYPHIKALGGTPAPEKELQAMAEALSPQLKRALRAMRVSPVAKPRVQDISGLTSRIGLKGGVMGQRAAAAIEESGLTEEDVTNLLRMKKAAGAN